MTDTIIEPTIVQVTVPGLQGPPGPSGAAGVQTLTLPASHDLSGHRAVVATAAGAAYADPGDPSYQDAVIGITTGAALAGETVSIQAAGEMVEPSWSWTPGQPIFVGASGALTQSPPANGWVQIVALAVTATRILIIGRQAILQ